MTRSYPRWLALTAGFLFLAGCTTDQAKPKSGASKSAMLTQLPAGAKSAESALTLGQSVSGSLEATDPTLPDSSHYDAWTYEGRRGERVTITLESGQFDSYMLLARSVNGSFQSVAEDDDGAGGTNSRITAELPEDGTYHVLANSYGGGATGAYSLRIDAATGPVTTPSTTSTTAPNWAARYAGGGDPRGRYALLVGIDDYQGIGTSLQGPVADARLIGRILVERFGFSPDNIVTITDREATREHIAEAFLRHLGQAGPDGVAVFYYSGHGMQMDSNYALSGALDPETERPKPIDEALYVRSDNGRGGVLLDDELGFLADRLQTNRVLFIIDACFSGTGTRAATSSATGSAKITDIKQVRGTLDIPAKFLTDSVASTMRVENSKGVSDLMSQPQRHLLLSASADNEVSWTATGWPKYGDAISVFTYYLAEALDTPPGNATFSQVMRRVGEQTGAYTRSRYGKDQTPQLEGQQGAARIREFLAAR